MKIAIHVDGPMIRGNEEQVIRIAEGLQLRGHDVVVSCRANGPVMAALGERGVRTTGIRPRGDVDIVSAAMFSGWLRREAVDAVLLTSWTRAFVAGAAAALARVPRVVFRLGGLQPLHKPRGRLERYALRHWYDAIIVNSRTVAERVHLALPDRPTPVHVVTNGISGASPDPLPVRAMLGIPDDAVVLAAVGGLEPNKGFVTIVRALRDVPDAHAVLAGSATPERRQAFDEAVSAAGVGERVHFLGWRGDVPALLAGSDIFVMSSYEEGFSVAKLEAMRAGLLLVSTDVGGTWESQGPCEGRPGYGWVVPAGDAAALAAALLSAIAVLKEGGRELAHMRDEARWRVANRFTVERMIDGYEAVLTGRATTPPG